jgi:hypothetical protein
MADRGTAVRLLARIRDFCNLQPDLEPTRPLIQRLQEAMSLEFLEQEDHYISPSSAEPHLHYTVCLRGPPMDNFTILAQENIM